MALKPAWAYIVTPAVVVFGVTGTVVQFIDFSQYFDKYTNINKTLLSGFLFFLLFSIVLLFNMTLLYLEKRPESKRPPAIQDARSGTGRFAGRTIVSIKEMAELDIGELVIVKRDISGSIDELGILEVIAKDNGILSCIVFKPFHVTVDDLESNLSIKSNWNKITLSPKISKSHI